MARIFDVIEYRTEMVDEIVHRFPDDSSIGDYHIGSQLIVRDGQAAVFFRNGQALDVFYVQDMGGSPFGCDNARNLDRLVTLLEAAARGETPAIEAKVRAELGRAAAFSISSPWISRT